ncbi:acyl-CoA dehydrogenase family protein [Amycolatopsis camponoti]|uniref:acyl-CoA dehydrogenase family protein n=1 Tax=Amycolatopsis camponoti TaxID=2606593 RepID=UPI001E5350B7|nr:acyl-CoA dehydrogenase family protein [Amycolatopsis camponoti]
MDIVIEILAANAAETEQRGRLASTSLKAAKAVGAFALRTPATHGGSWATATTVADVIAAMARDCPSTAWIVSTCLVSKNMITFGDFPDHTLDELFADPDALFCGVGAPTGRGESGPDGVRVSGRWAAVSGCEDATWASLGTIVDGEFALVLVPTAELSVDHTWDMAGMRGTGSHSLVADDILVPLDQVASGHRVHYPPDPKAINLWGLSVLATVVGATFGALDVIGSMFASPRKPFMTSYTRMSDSPGARHWLAEATTLAQRAERTMQALAARIDAEPAVTPLENSRMQQERADAATDCRAAIERMLDLHGASGFATSNALQRFWRDVAVAGRHPQLNPYLAVEGFGRLLSDAT